MGGAARLGDHLSYSVQEGAHEYDSNDARRGEPAAAVLRTVVCFRSGLKALLVAAFGVALGAMSPARECRADPLHESVAHLYEMRGSLPLWFVDQRLTAAGRAMLQELGHAEARGLRSRDYDAAHLQNAVAGLDAKSADSLPIGSLDFALSVSAARLATDLHSGRVNPREVGYDLDLPHPHPDFGAVLTALATTPNVPAALDALEPPFRHYRLLKEALADTRRSDSEIRKIELTLERVRWLPAKLDSPPIFVNIPQFKLFAFRTTDDFAQDILQMNVIVGAAFKERETPVFAADMRYIVLRPYWDVPMSIMRKEYLPLMRASASWAERNGFEIVRGQTDAAVVMPPTPENIELLAQGKLRLRQKPGPNNALGLVKFMLPNRHNVYLHDTPVQSLFKKSKRAFSHGCIRVSNPMSLLAHVLRDDSEWTQDRIDAAFDSGETMRIPLKKPVRVFIIYGTALATEAGETLFFDDLYQHDSRLETALDARSLRLAQDRP